MAAPPAKELLLGLKETLKRQYPEFEDRIREFGQVSASEDREADIEFPLSMHVRGLILSQLSSQRPWKPVADNLKAIEHVFSGYDPQALELADPVALTKALLALRVGNRATAKQMDALATNIATFRRIESKCGSMDSFVDSAEPETVASQLGQPGRPYKLKQVGLTLALEYLRNVGIRAGKPDVHVRRALSGERLGYFDGHPSELEAYRKLGELAEEAGCNPTYLDNLLWLFCAKNYGKVCGDKPRCSECAFRLTCNYPRAPAT
jgi:hypothetical protein